MEVLLATVVLPRGVQVMKIPSDEDAEALYIPAAAVAV